MYCPKCGWKNPDNATKCANCSADVAAPQPTVQQPAQPQPPQPYQQAQYPQYPQQQYPYQYPAAKPQANSSFALVGLILGIISLFFCPILFGGAGITLGIIGHNKGEKLGMTAIIVSVCCMIAGFVLGMVVWAGMRTVLHNMPN